MARKSRYSRPAREPSPGASRHTAAVYLRLSVEDGDSAESNSIGNQRKLCLAFLERHDELSLGGVYVDDGRTGMNFKRPGFEAMLSDLRAGRVNCVLTKDVSRLGRHFIMTSEYVERIFPEMQVRLICINDGYDSADPRSDRDSLLMPFKLMMNDTYVKDTARRIRSSIHAKMDAGEYLPASGSVPYGYLRPPRGAAFEVDPETAPVVQRIFRLRSQGAAFNAIAKTLNAEAVPSPGRLRYDRGLTKSETFRGALWVRGTIRKITNDTVYLGDRVHGKISRTRLGAGRKNQPKDSWRIIPGAHPAIITEELFGKVQAVNRAELDRLDAFQKRGGPRQDFRGILRGKVFCGDCGAKMSAAKTVGRESTPPSVCYNCNQYRDSNHQRCGNHYIRQEPLMDALRDFLDRQMETAVDVEHLAAAARKAERSPGGAQSRLASLHSQRVNLEAKLERLWEDAASGLLDREEYMRIKGRYTEERALLLGREQTAREELQRIRQSLGAAEAWLDQLRRCHRLPILDRALVDALVDRILVYENREVRIVLTYQDPAAPLAALLDGGAEDTSRAG